MESKKYWTTLDQLENNAAYQEISEQEFKVKPEADMEEGGGLVSSRRNFIKATGAAAVFMGAVGCIKEKKLVPYFEQPEEVIPGNPVYYASITDNGESGLIVKTTEGRPIKTNGNPKHAVNKGKLNATGNALILDLYDPDRIRDAMTISENKATKATKTVAELEKDIADQLKAAGSNALWVTGPMSSPTEKRVIAKVKKAFPAIKHIMLTDTATESLVQAQKAAYGKSVLPTFKYDKADLLISFGYDFLSENTNPVETDIRFANAKRYKEGKGMLRFVSFEPILSAAGASADERFRVHHSDLKFIALAVAKEVAKQSGAPVSTYLKSVFGSVSTEEIEKNCKLKSGLISSVAQELVTNKGKGIALAGGINAEPETYAAANYINSVLGNDGKTVAHGDGAILNQVHTDNGTKELLSVLKSGSVKALLIQDVNVAYTMAAVTGVEKALQSVPFKAGLFSHMHETALCTDIVLPINHCLENWLDAEPRKGLYAVGQPTIKPLWNTQAKQQYLLNIAAASTGAKAETYKDLIKATWKSDIYNSSILAASFDAFWESCLRQGVYDVAEQAREKDTSARRFNEKTLKPLTAKKEKGARVLLYKTSMHNNGESMNNPWLIEAPDPISKICWDNYASVSLKTGKKYGFSEGDIIKLTQGEISIEIPVHLQPGTKDDVFAISLGWGRRAGGHVAAGEDGNGLGIDASFLAIANGDHVQYASIPVKVEMTGKKTTLACMQGHQYLENSRTRFNGEGQRNIVQDATLKEFEDPNNRSYELKYHSPTDISLWRQKFPSAEHKWAMHIDTNVCNGCNACTISCQAENNIPCVGKGEVIINREMHWIRIDRYYVSNNQSQHGKVVENSDEVELVNQPMLCQHCDNAPCETVCPVVATTHNDEGLNVQTYNRCVGTRYCSNNCPYKVRHYNWYDYKDYRAGIYGSANPFKRFIKSLTHKIEDKTEYPLMLQLNPDVTVRSRGVMEKCSFCIHKIRRWDTEEKALGRELPESEKQAACQQACPSNAITFGNILDKNSAITKAFEQKGNYGILKEINPGSNIRYFTKLRNREPEPLVASNSHEGSHH